MLWAGGGGVVCVILLLEGVIEASAHHVGDGTGMKVTVCSYQRRWRLRTSVPFLKASLEGSCYRASAPSASTATASRCATLRLLLPRRSSEVAPYCIVPACASFYSSHRLPCLGRCCRCSRSAGHSDYLVVVDVKAAVARFTVATWSLLMLPLQSLGSQRLPGRCWSCRCSRSVDHSGYLVAVVAVILVLPVDALPPRLHFLSGQPLR